MTLLKLAQSWVPLILKLITFMDIFPASKL